MTNNMAPWSTRNDIPLRPPMLGYAGYPHTNYGSTYGASYGTTLGAFSAQGSMANFVPAIEFEESYDAIVLRCELPGMTEQNIEIITNGHTLVLRGEKRYTRTTNFVGNGNGTVATSGIVGVQTDATASTWNNRWDVPTFSERTYGPFERVVALPEDVNTDAVEAFFRNGLLEIRVPRRGGLGTQRRVQIHR